MLTLLLSLGTAHAGAWTQPAGDSYGKLTTRILVGSNAYVQGGAVPVGSYTDLSVQAYYEVGLSDHLTVVYTGTPLGRATYEDASSLYLGPNSVGLRRSLWEADLRVAVEGRVGWAEPFGQTDLATASGSDKTPEGYIYSPAVANHWVDLEIAVGRGIKNGWVTGSIGGRSSTGEGFGNAVIGFFQGGYVFKQKFVVDLHVPLYLPTNPVEVQNISGAGDTAYVGMGIGFGWWFRQRVGLSLTADGAAYADANAASPSFAVGLQFR